MDSFIKALKFKAGIKNIVALIKLRAVYHDALENMEAVRLEKLRKVMARILCRAFSRAYRERYSNNYGREYEHRTKNVIRRALTFLSGVIQAGPGGCFDIER